MKKETIVDKIVKEVKLEALKNDSSDLSHLQPVQHLFNVQIPEGEDIFYPEQFEGENIDLRKISNKYEKNPFLFNSEGEEFLKLALPKTKKQTIGKIKNLEMVNTETGQIEGGNYIYKNIQVDEEQFAKIYLNQMHLIYGLTKPALIVLHYILNNIKPNDDKVYLYVPKVKEFGNWKTKKQVFQALKELTINKIIAPSLYPGIWFINIYVIFNGNRLVLVQNYQKKEKDEKQQLYIDSKD
jgi:hypothetical protein